MKASRHQRAAARGFVVIAYVIGTAYGCASEDASSEDDSAAAPETTVPARARGASPAAEMDVGSIAAGTTITSRPAQGDRCHTSSCEDSELPRQSELSFLEEQGDGWVRLIEMDWEMAAGAEGYRCKTFTVPEDVYVSEFAPQVPAGTHHATFGVSATPLRPDGVFNCGVGDVGDFHLQGAGVGSEPSAMPPGVAMPLRRGAQIYMNLHLFNVGEQPMHGRSGMWVRTMPAAAVVAEAENVPAGPLQLDIPVGRSTQRGTCTLRADATLFSTSPHMHRTGVHMRATVLNAAGDEHVLFDGGYDFERQITHDIGPFQLERGDRVSVECTYENDTDSPLHWGDSSVEEMCFFGMLLYPAFGYGSDPCWF